MWEFTIVGEHGGTIKLEHTHTDLDYPSFALNIVVENDGFRGADSQVWYFVSDLHEFISQLRDLEKNRKGRAQLITMSDESDYYPFRLRISSYDKLGHMAVSIVMQKIAYVGGEIAPHVMSTSFEIDPSELPKIVESYRELLREFE